MNLPGIRRTYHFMAPVYDRLFRRFYRNLRRESIAALDLQAPDVIVLVGAGTGLDIPHLPRESRTFAIDVTPEMIRRAAATGRHRAGYVLADGAALPLRDASVSVVILHLVLSVAPAPAALLAEAARVLRVGGRVAILDHFAPPGRLGLARRILAGVPSLLGTHFDRRFEDLALEPRFAVIRDQRLARGWYRTVVLRRLEG